MSGYLWKYYFEDDLFHFKQLLENANQASRSGSQRIGFYGIGSGTIQRNQVDQNTRRSVGNEATAAYVGDGGIISNSLPLASKGKKPFSLQNVTLTRSDLNSRDTSGLTLLHHASSSMGSNALAFATALLEHSYTDICIQDIENGWTALHRAFYFGNIAIAKQILLRYAHDLLKQGRSSQSLTGDLIKIKDREGNGPLDLFNLTIKEHILAPGNEAPVFASADSDDDSAQGEYDNPEDFIPGKTIPPSINLASDEVFTFGSNQNVTLGFGDEDDRQHPERVVLRRPHHLLERFFNEHVMSRNQMTSSQAEQAVGKNRSVKSSVSYPVIIRSRPLLIQDIRMSKLHTAVITTDPESNLYMCGHGPGGRLGLGDEVTRHYFECVEDGALTGKKVNAIALGQNHSLALSDLGEVFSWGNNKFGQLGYSLPRSNAQDEDPIQTLPRQIYGPLKRESVIGIAASRIHSVVHTPTAIYTFGKNEGQLGIVDSDARSLEIQTIPRRIAASLFSSPIISVCAIEKATICLLENREVWTFANYGYAKIMFPLDGFTNSFLKNSFLATKYEKTPNRIMKVTAGGDIVCAMSSAGEIFTFAVSKRTELANDTNISTTNPNKIRGALSQPCRIWSVKHSHMAARDVDVDQDGSVILTTESGSVWRRLKRNKISGPAQITEDYRPQDYKFSRIPGLTRIVAVRSSAHGAYAAVRKDCSILKTRIVCEKMSIWSDLFALFPFRALASSHSDYQAGNVSSSPPRGDHLASSLFHIRRAALMTEDFQLEVASLIQHLDVTIDGYDLFIGTTTSDLIIPVHKFMLESRSSFLREVLNNLPGNVSYELSDIWTTEISGKQVLHFRGLDFLTIFNLVFYIYTDGVVDFWNHTRQKPQLAHCYRTIRTELMRIASVLGLKDLETAVRQMTHPRAVLNLDMESAFQCLGFLKGGNTVIRLADGEIQAHGPILCQRCPFFYGLFKGRARGLWLHGRKGDDAESVRVDFKHITTHVFRVILRHIYADSGEELFDDIISDDFTDYLALEEFLDHVVDVMAVANELMLDRLSLICQRIVGRYTNVRNVCQHLNAIAPSSVTEFKDAALTYICINLEAVIQSGTLQELDDDLLFDLDDVIRDTQRVCQPFAKSGEADAELFGKYPDLMDNITRSKQTMVDSMMSSSKVVERHRLTSAKPRNPVDSPVSPAGQYTRRKSSKTTRLGVESLNQARTALSHDDSILEMMFDMSDGEGNHKNEGRSSLNNHKVPKTPDSRPQSAHSRATLGGFTSISPIAIGSSDSYALSPMADSSSNGSLFIRSTAKPWGESSLSISKLDMKSIMEQTSSDRISGISVGLATRPSESEYHQAVSNPKLSQKERKRLQQSTREVSGEGSEILDSQKSNITAWQSIAGEGSSSRTSATRSDSATQLTMRQTIAKGSVPVDEAGSSKSRSIPPRQLSQSNSRNVVQGVTSFKPVASPGAQGKSAPSLISTPTPRSVRHIPISIPSYSSPKLLSSLSDIVSQQQAEKDIIRDAAAKRSLQDIQIEQEFQEWWDQESRKLMQEEETKKQIDEQHTRGIKNRKGVRTKSDKKTEKTEDGRSLNVVPSSTSNVNRKVAHSLAENNRRHGSQGKGKSNAPRSGKDKDSKAPLKT